jgi:hypothetical protein
MVLILKLLLIAVEPLLLILMFLKKIGMCIMNLLKTLAWKVKLLLMIAINMLKLLKELFLISMLIFVKHLDLVKRIKSMKNIVSTTEMKKTRMWDRALNDLGEKVCALYPFICELCYKVGHFSFQCSGYDNSLSNPMSTANLYCDDMITPNQHDELTLFLGSEELSRKTSLVDMSAFDRIATCMDVNFIVLIIATQILTYKML